MKVTIIQINDVKLSVAVIVPCLRVNHCVEKGTLVQKKAYCFDLKKSQQYIETTALNMYN